MGRWNPLRCAVGGLPSPVAALAKAIAAAVLCSGTGWIPAVPCAALLFNVAPRISAVALGATVLFAMPWAVWGWLLVLVALYHPATDRWPLQIAVVAAYFLNPGLPAGLLGAVLLFPPVKRWSIWASVLYQTAALLRGGELLPFIAMQAGMLAFVAWPREATVIFDGECGICRKIRGWLDRVDFDGAFAWVALQSAAVARFGIAREALESRMHVVAGGRIAAGFRACKWIVLYNPALYVAAAAVVSIGLPRLLVAAAIAAFLPLFDPIGNAAYDWVARNRHRLGSEGSCAVDTGQAGP
ncbi:MAG: DUF393 domain-containing protein [Bryobacteraceae bacterium]